MSCCAHEIMPEEYSWYSGTWSVNPLAELNVVFFCDVMAKQMFHPCPTTTWKTKD